MAISEFDEIKKRVKSGYEGYDTSALLGHSHEMEKALEDLEFLIAYIEALD